MSAAAERPVAVQFLASCPRGLADLLVRELVSFGAEAPKERSTGVAFSAGGAGMAGALRVVYRACLESRIANRVFLELGRFDVADAQAFYAAVRTIDWSAHLAPGATLACDFTGRHPTITHTHFGALKLKDAIVDSVRERSGVRPDVAVERPDVRVHAHAQGTAVTVSLDLSGESLHRRGYRGEAGEAPLKENVAAGILMRCGWEEMVGAAARGAAGLAGGPVDRARAHGAAAAVGAQVGGTAPAHGGTRVGDADAEARVDTEVGAAEAEACVDTEVGAAEARVGSTAGSMAQFLDPMCGSGTFAIEAALIAADIAPGLTREYFGFLGWRGHDPAVWREVLEDARRRAREGVARFAREDARRTAPGTAGRLVASGALGDAAREAPGDAAREAPGDVAREVPGDAAREVPQAVSASGLPRLVIRGQDRDAGAVRMARANAERAGVGHLVGFEVKTLADAAPPSLDGASAGGTDGVMPRGLVCVNPPYGVRLEDHNAALALHRELGKVLRERFQGWIAGVLIGAPELGMELGIRAYRTHAMWNGALECRLLRLKIDSESQREPGRLAKPDASIRESPGARMFANRLSKNLKRLQSWAAREGICCYRLYDADMPEYAFAIDIYKTIDPDRTWLYVQEYAAPAEIELEAVRRRRNEALSVLPEVTRVPQEQIRVRTRRRNKRGEQYRKVDDQANFHYTTEGGLKFRVNFDDYLDTGLFLDHRITRARLREMSNGKRFLNLFAYTGTATVYAVAGGAVATTSVDMSRTYLDWAQRNLSVNRLIGQQHALVQADCVQWLQESVRGAQRYDLIFLDPPTFSNSKRMEGVLDVERDHVALIDSCVKLLSPDGLLVFSTNAQRFKLDAGLAQRYAVRDVSAATLPKDFERNQRIHRCFEIR